VEITKKESERCLERKEFTRLIRWWLWWDNEIEEGNLRI